MRLQLNGVIGLLPQNIMTYIFHIFTSQELCQSTDQIHNEISQVQSVFPESAFLKTQRALLFYHSKGKQELLLAFGSFLAILCR